ncbi:MAG: hypothetical protein ABIP63_04475 [Thermoanaerobaculia bacterium]
MSKVRTAQTLLIAATILCAATTALHAQTRMASDFEIAQMEQQLSRSRDFLAQLSGHLNLGDLRTSRNETSLAREEYRKASEIALAERLRSRNAADLARYTTATSYAALAAARLGRESSAFELAEESIRYGSDAARSWNLYASSMALLHKSAKAVSASRNAVAIDQRNLAKESTVTNRLDLAVDQYALATSLTDTAQEKEAESLLQTVVASLRSSAFQELQRDAVRREAFEVYSSARGDATAYVSLLNRAQLRLAGLLERRGDLAGARAGYEQVLAARTDDPTALAALARITAADSDRSRFYAEAFDANPFSPDLVRQYQQYLRTHPAAARQSTASDARSTGEEVRRLLIAAQRGQIREARTILDRLTSRFPENDTLRMLRRELDVKAAELTAPRFLEDRGTQAIPTAAELRALIALFQEQRLTPEQRIKLDALTFVSSAIFDTVEESSPEATSVPPQTIFESGSSEGVLFRFSEPIAFAGVFAAGTPLTLTYRVTGGTDRQGVDALLLEPLGLGKR